MQRVTFKVTLEDGTNLEGSFESVVLTQGIDKAKEQIISELDFVFSAWQSVEITIDRQPATN